MSTESAWSRFRTWRRSRPFWGGLFLLLSALVLFLSANLTLKDLQVHIGQEGYLSYLLPAILILCGLLSWFSPSQRLFYGILGLLTALYSFLGLNLGGFLIGMLLGIVGGALTVSWGPPRVKAPPAAEEPEPEPEDDQPEPQPADPEVTAIMPGFGDKPEGGGGSAGGVHRKLMVITFVPLALTVALLVAGSHTPAHADPECPKGLPYHSASAEPGKEAGPGKEQALHKAATPKRTPAVPARSASPTPTPTPASTTAATAGKDSNPIADGWNKFVQGVGKVLGVGGDEPPSPSADPTTPAPSVSATPTPTPTTAGPPATGTPTPGGSGSASASPSPSVTPSSSDVPCLGARVFKSAEPDGESRVSIHGGLLEGRSLNMYGSTYDGTIDLPTADGTVKALKFSMTKAVTEPFSLTIAEASGHRTVIRSSKLTIDRDVKFYTPDFQGKLFGLFPVTFTPDSPPPLTLPWLWFTDVKINLAFVSCGTLTAGDLDISEG